MTEIAHATDNRIDRLSLDVTSADLRFMTLANPQLPEELAEFEALRDGTVSNEDYAKSGDSLATMEKLAAANRIGGYETVFVVPQGGATLAEEPADLLEVSTAVHLFELPVDVHEWIDKALVQRLLRSVGETDALDRKITGVQQLQPPGFYGHAAGLLILRDVPGGELAATSVAFQVGRIMGVAAATTKVVEARLDLAVNLGGRLERQIVRVILGG